MTDQSPFIWHELVTPDQKKSGIFFLPAFWLDAQRSRCREVRYLHPVSEGRSGCCRNDGPNTGDTKQSVILAFLYRCGKCR